MVFRLRENVINTKLNDNQVFRVLQNDLGLREISVLFFFTIKEDDNGWITN